MPLPMSATSVREQLIILPEERIQKLQRGVGKKHEIEAAAFGGHLFMTIFTGQGEGTWPTPWIHYGVHRIKESTSIYWYR